MNKQREHTMLEIYSIVYKISCECRTPSERILAMLDSGQIYKVADVCINRSRNV